MIKSFITVVWILFPLFIFSQKKYNEAVSSALRVLNVHQSSLNQLSPFEEGGMENIMRLNRKVEEKLLELLNQKYVVEVEKDTIPFFTCESKDKNFAIFSWQENLGGTFYQYENIFYWKNENGIPHATVMAEEVAPYSEIYQIKNEKNKTLYLLLGSGISCNTCRYEKVLLLQTNKLNVEEVFSFQIDYRLNNDITGLKFDEKTKQLTYEFIEEGCEEEEGENCWVRGKFIFDGNTFVEVED